MHALTFDQNFKLMSAYRNLIRQRMIENRLDDRHDLEGNSLYILKFDSTVLGVPSLNERAVIQVRILPPTELTRLTAREAETILGAVNSHPEILSYTQANYNNWKESLAARMNAILNADLRELRRQPILPSIRDEAGCWTGSAIHCLRRCWRASICKPC